MKSIHDYIFEKLKISKNNLPSKETKINKNGAKCLVYVTNIGKFSSSGKTNFDWNFWDYVKEQGYVEIYTDYGMEFLFGTPGSLSKGDTLVCVNNDTNKKVPGASVPKQVLHVFNIKSKEDFADKFRKAFPDRCKQPSSQFGKNTDGLPWNTGRYAFKQIYSIESVSE